MTRREEIIKLLEKQPMTASDLAQYFGVTRREVLQDMPHVKRSIKPPARLRMRPAQCASCGFVFQEDRIKPPSKCPRCRNEKISEPSYYVR